MANKRLTELHFHEALGRSSILLDAVDRHLCEHVAIKSDPSWRKLADTARQSLFNLYQATGAREPDVRA